MSVFIHVLTSLRNQDIDLSFPVNIPFLSMFLIRFYTNRVGGRPPCSIAGFRPARFRSLSPWVPNVCSCKHGSRSAPYPHKKPGGLSVSSRANGKTDVIILMSHFFEALWIAVGRPGHMICLGIKHSTTHDSILSASFDTVHHLHLLHFRCFNYKPEWFVGIFVHSDCW